MRCMSLVVVSLILFGLQVTAQTLHSARRQSGSLSYRTFDDGLAAVDAAVRRAQIAAALYTPVGESPSSLTSSPIDVESGTYGLSIHGRPLRWVRFGPSRAAVAAASPASPFSAGTIPRARLVVLSAIHAREWLALEAGLRGIEALSAILVRCSPGGVNASGVTPASPQDSATCTSADQRIVALLRGTDLLFAPLGNPDGIMHTHTSGGRYWRKNRRGGGADGTSIPIFGVDLNRNWYSPHLHEMSSSDSSLNQDSELYRGSAPFSEPETAGFRGWLDAEESGDAPAGGQGITISSVAAVGGGRQIDGLVSLHTYGKIIVYPPGDSMVSEASTDRVDTTAFAHQVGLGLQTAMGPGSDGTQLVSADCLYDVHSAANQYVAYGDTPDWFWRRPMDRTGLKADSYMRPAYTIELPPGQCSHPGASGFAADEKYIVPVAAEVMRGILWMAEYLEAHKVAKVRRSRVQARRDVAFLPNRGNGTTLSQRRPTGWGGSRAGANANTFDWGTFGVTAGDYNGALVPPASLPYFRSASDVPITEVGASAGASPPPLPPPPSTVLSPASPATDAASPGAPSPPGPPTESDSAKSGASLSTSAIVGLVIGSIVFAFVVLAIVVCVMFVCIRVRKGRKNTRARSSYRGADADVDMEIDGGDHDVFTPAYPSASQSGCAAPPVAGDVFSSAGPACAPWSTPGSGSGATAHSTGQGSTCMAWPPPASYPARASMGPVASANSRHVPPFPNDPVVGGSHVG
eukprot:TRINITY_DN36187_c0_g1_i1.p1 TRINITY_DN36187_c0_g1~~TRINITY_DN36187_c0_g1_i1.p1  ORF type:complete len:747 (+),score=92.23 TRINITY_DN36187_c0_g1_i1:134-2374(+)